MTVRNWSTTPGSNNSAPPNGAPEGQSPGSVNNVIRQNMADIRDTFEQLPFFDAGHTPTRVDADTFTVPTDLTATYYANRRLKLVGATTGYATISSSSYSAPDTTVNVVMDSGNVPTSLTTVSLGFDTANAPTLSTAVKYDITAAETAASVTPVNYYYFPKPWVDIHRFGNVDLTGAIDCSAIIQLAINSLILTGGTIFFPSGIYKISFTANWVSTLNQGLPGIYFVGEGGTGGPNGAVSTKFVSYIASGPMFNIRGTKTQASGGTGSLFFNGGGFRDIYMDGTNATGTSQAMNVQGWQYAKNTNCTITGFPGDGVTQSIDAGFANGDYSSSSIDWENCWFWDNAAYGVNQTGYVGAWSWGFRKCLFGYNGDGIKVTSSGNSFIDCSWVGSGYKTTTGTRGNGLHIVAGVSSGSSNRLYLRGCEFDFCRTKHISLDYFQTVEIQKSRFIFNDRKSTGSLTPPIGIDIASAGAGSNVTSVRMEQVNIRIDTPGTLSVFKISNTSNVSDIKCVDTVVSDNTATSLTFTGALVAATSGTLTAGFAGTTGTYLIRFSDGSTKVTTLTNASTSVSWTGAVTATANITAGANITTYDGFQTSNVNLRYNYFAIEGGNVLVPGRPAPSYIGSTTTATSIPTGSFVTVPYDTQDTVNAQIYPAGASPNSTTFYNTTTGKFTAYATGFYEVQADLQISGTTSADTIRAAIVYNGNTIERDFLGFATSSGISCYSIPPTIVYVPAGSTIEIQARSPANARSLSTTASLPSRLMIRLVNDGR